MTFDEFRKLLFFGTDGETALISAMEESAPLADHLRCFIHFRKNLIEKMKDIGLTPFEQSIVIGEVFGRPEGAIFVEGLVDSDDDSFAADLVALCHAWIARLARKGTLGELVLTFTSFPKDSGKTVPTKVFQILSCANIIKSSVQGNNLKLLVLSQKRL